MQIRHVKKLVIFIISFVTLLFGATFASTGNISLSPTTGNLGMRCVYPIEFSVNVDSAEIKAMDMRVIYSGDNMQFTGANTGSLSFGTYLNMTGVTTTGTSLGRATYPVGSPYQLFNWSSLLEPLSGASDQLYYTRYFQTITNTLTGYLDFYYVSGRNGDDSNIQSGVENDFIDILGSVNSGYYNFAARPCILDVDAPLFTGYLSGETRPYTSGIVFTIYDFTGSRTSGYDSTYHYWWTGAVEVDYDDYTGVASLDIDNQYGVNSGTIIVTLSGLSLEAGAFTGEPGGIYSGTALVFTSFTLSSLNNSDLFDCTPTLTDVDIGYTMTWHREDRGYDCTLTSTGLVGSDGVGLEGNQTLIVMVTGADNINYASTNNTGYTDFILTINGIDNTPPYIELSEYYWTGAVVTGDNYTGAGPLFSADQQSGWVDWTQNDVEIQLTGSEIIIITNVLGYSGTDLNIYVKDGSGFSGVNQTLVLTGNMSGFITFQDIPDLGMNPNYGQTYLTGATRYTYDFNIDVFWIDRVTTEITGSLYYTGTFGQFHQATLSITGYATGYAGSIKDDEIIIYQYSGVDGAGAPTVTGYDSGTYTLTPEIVFLDNWTGYVYYRDRANNTGEFYVNVTGIDISDGYTIIAVPSNRADLSSYGLSNSGTIARFTFVSGYSSSSFTSWTGEIIFSGLAKMNSTGTYTFDYGFTFGSGYSLIFESQTHVSEVMTGLEITGSRVFDYTTIGDGEITAGDLLLFQLDEDFLTTGSIKDGEVNAGDIGAILSWVQMSGGYQIYSGGFHVWTGSTFVPASPLVDRLPFVQYHPGDVNADGDIKSTDIAIINANLDNRSVRTRNDTTFFDIFD